MSGAAAVPPGCHDAAAMGFASLGRNVRIYAGARIVGCANIRIGDDVVIDDFVLVYATAPVHIGSQVHIASFTSISGGGEVWLDDFCGLSSGVRIVSGSEDFAGGSCLTNPTVPAAYRQVRRAPVRIGAHAIVGANSSVLPGVSVGEGCAVGAQSLVAKDLPPWGVYLGVPARRIGERPSADIHRLAAQLRHDKGPTATWSTPA